MPMAASFVAMLLWAASRQVMRAISPTFSSVSACDVQCSAAHTCSSGTGAPARQVCCQARVLNSLITSFGLMAHQFSKRLDPARRGRVLITALRTTHVLAGAAQGARLARWLRAIFLELVPA